MAVNYSKYIDSTTTHYISNSGHDENNKYNSGKAGDQTGKEWELKSWYNRPWSVVLRYPDPVVALKIADLAIDAALNNNIGYDQYQRKTYWNELEKVGYDPSKIKTPCEADCTAGVTANVKAVGYLLGIKKLQSLAVDTYSGNMKSRFVSAGFTALTAKKYTGESTYLLPGDILLYEGHHAATNITYGKKAEKYNDHVPSTPSLPDNGKTMKRVSVTKGSYYIRKGPATSYDAIGVSRNGCQLVYLGIEENGWYKVLAPDGTEGWISKKCGEIIDVPAEEETPTVIEKEYLKVKSGTWNIRTGPATSYKILGTVKAGNKLEYLGETQNNWYKIKKSKIEGWVSGKAF